SGCMVKGKVNARFDKYLEELRDNNAIIVMDDADVELVVSQLVPINGSPHVGSYVHPTIVATSKDSVVVNKMIDAYVFTTTESLDVATMIRCSLALPLGPTSAATSAAQRGRQSGGLWCFSCGELGHQQSACPQPGVGRTLFTNETGAFDDHPYALPEFDEEPTERIKDLHGDVGMPWYFSALAWRL
ncbi:aldehyde dehydrogenase, partial [Striga asiatica]